MEQNQQVILSIKRTLGTFDGQVINYLHSRPFDLGNLPEIVMLTLLEYWSPFAISANGVDGEELRQRAIWSIKKLEAQAALIREVFLESKVKTAVIANNAEVSDSAVQQRLVSTINNDDDQSLDEVIICGGTAEFVRKELTQHFEKEGIPIVWNGNVEMPKRLDTQGLDDRLADVWTAHITYIKILDHNFGYERKTDLVPDYHQSPSVRNSTPPKEVWEKNGFLTMHPGV